MWRAGVKGHPQSTAQTANGDGKEPLPSPFSLCAVPLR
jgi:hypothetical protein